MMKPIIVFGTLLGTLLTACSIKHVPFSNLWGNSSIVMTAGALAAVGFKIGWRELFVMFLGKGDKQNVRLAVVALAMSAGLGMTLGLFVVLNNLQNPDTIGPALAASSIVIVYSLFLIVHLAIMNAPKGGRESRKNFSKYTSVTVTDVSLNRKEIDNEKHAA